MNDPLRILSVEDAEMDRELIEAALQSEGLTCQFVYVTTEKEVREALGQAQFDIILSDFTLPSFCGAQALVIARVERPEIPFIFVSGTIGEQRAIEVLREGATDYVLKDRLDRLGPAVRRALREARESADRLRAEQQLRLFRSLIDHTNDVIEVIDPETGRIIDVNEKACQVRGYTRPEILRMTIFELAAHSGQFHESTFRKSIADMPQTGSKIMESYHRRKDGSIFPVEINLNYIALDRPYLVAVVRDITDRKRAEEELRASEERFRQVVENIREVFWLTDPEKKTMLYVSPAYERIWGRTCQSLYRSPWTWLEAIHLEDRERVLEAVRDKQPRGEYDETYRVIRPDGSQRWVHDRAFPIRDGEGNIYRFVGVAEDITEHRQLEEKLRQSQKMEAVGQLAGGIAHDFNNMMAVIQMHSSLLLDTEELSAPVKSSLQDITAAAERAGNLTRQLLTFSRREVKQAANLNLDEVIDTMIKLLRRILGENIAIETRFASSLPVVHADAGMIEQIIMNLAINARDAMPNGGRLSVSLEPVEIDGARTAAHPDVIPGRFVCLTVRDTGSGIPPENLSRIFEPFFTTKEVGKGTGLGLATVFGIVAQHRGWIEVESEINHGATFRVFLPAIESETPSLAVEPAQTKPIGGSETILLVEDEATLRTISRLVLEQHGYRVLAANDPAAALGIWENQRGAIDLLLTDLIMPGGMCGRELAERLLADEPKLKVIYTSGYSEDIVSRHLHLDPGRTFLEKPCSSAALLATVRCCLDGAPA